MKTCVHTACLAGVLVGTGLSRGGEVEIIDGVPAGYEVVRVTDEPVRSTIPVINDLGEVVWGRRDGDTISNVQIFSGGLVTTLPNEGGFDTWPAINNASEIIWMRCQVPFNPPCSMEASFSAGPIHGTLTPTGKPEINHTGDVVWSTEIQGEDNHQEIVLYNREIDAAEIITSVGLQNSEPRINETRHIVWTRFDFNAAPWRSTILLWRDGVVTSMSSGTSQAQGPDLNDSGFVIWRDGVEIFLWDGASVTNISEDLEPSAVQPRINNRNDIYFGLWNDELARWDAVFLTNGSFYRLPGLGLESEQGTLNNRGEIAWRGGIDPGFNSNVLLLRRIEPDGDMNHDCHVDLVDMRIMQICHTGADAGPENGLLAQCARADFDDDGDVDAEDFEAFSDSQTGPDEFVLDCEL